MRKRFEPQLTLGSTPIEQIIIPTKSRDEFQHGIIRGRDFDMQTIKDNVSLLDDATLRNINDLIVASGHKVVKKKKRKPCVSRLTVL